MPEVNEYTAVIVSGYTLPGGYRHSIVVSPLALLVTLSFPEANGWTRASWDMRDSTLHYIASTTGSNIDITITNIWGVK